MTLLSAVLLENSVIPDREIAQLMMKKLFFLRARTKV